MKRDFPYRLYLVTDQKACLGRDFFWVVEEAIKGGVDIVQLREKDLSIADFIRKAEKLKILCDQYEVPLIINDSIEVARTVEANGIHIGQSDASVFEVQETFGQYFPVGLSIEHLEEIKSDQAKHAWYYGVSPIFSTPTKMDTKSEWGLKGLQSLREISNKALVAIGNIKIHNAAAVIQAGADCLAIVSGICSAKSPSHAAESFKKEIEKGLNKVK
ncbi:thiamine-phosphate diphosphorylase [Belliella buryatensis]|uniref:Thiamine-phosphate synthase n=1 Tax=Belliella buryatensis TaxID=1500549 RepID=A0A239ABD7_9BACT|nr:thiamine phosphate synthase [Belliella buryatensis]SNR92702.1 thiamine-phosphate diphosphorylase [Belliella buryatensis]